MANSYYTASGKAVSDGNTANASDLNTINTAIETAFDNFIASATITTATINQTVIDNNGVTIVGGDDLKMSATSDLRIGEVGSESFYVYGATGNVTIGGTLAVSGAITASSGITGAVTCDDSQDMNLSNTSLLNVGTSGLQVIANGATGTLSCDGQFTAEATILCQGLATFQGNVGVNGVLSANETAYIQAENGDNDNVLHLYQKCQDAEEGFLEFQSYAIAEGEAIEAAGVKNLTATHFIKCKVNGVAGYVYLPVGTIA